MVVRGQYLVRSASSPQLKAIGSAVMKKEARDFSPTDYAYVHDHI
jgi:hypothetical protein